jgi:alpha-L-rhamnosidase
MTYSRCARLRVEYGSPLLGVGTATPRLSWIVETDRADWRSEAYELVGTIDGVGVSATVDSTEQVLVPWPFEPLSSRVPVSMRVRARSSDGWSEFSAPVSFETGLLHESDWSARFISPATLGGLDAGPPIVFTNAALPSAAVRARLHVTALGAYEFSVNGERVGDEILAPGWTSYRHRVRYQTYDVTAMLGPGENRLQALLGNGWYRGQLVGHGNRGSYGTRLGLLAQLELEYADGSVETIVTNGTWRACASGILFDDLYDGQRTDLRIANDPDGKASEGVDVLSDVPPAIVAAESAPVRVTGVRPAEAIIRSPSGATIIDFGQNLVGWVRIRVSGAEPGQLVTVRHAEVLEGGELGVRPLRSAKATSEYVLSGNSETLQPTFTFNGFRYAEITGLPTLELADVDALVIGSDLDRTGWFDSSNAELNRLHENVVWSMRGNFLSIPTDCPQRDERLGWTGDIQVFAPTASFLYDSDGFLSSWLRDLALDQKPDGGVPYIVPDVFTPVTDPKSAGWSDAATIVPSVLFERFGDAGVIERQYESMRAWVDKVRTAARADLIWDSGFQFGDWLDPTAPPDDSGKAKADPTVIATAYFHRSAALVSRAADLLGRESDAALYGSLATGIRDAFNAAFVDPSGIVTSDCQTVYALALAWDLIEDVAARQAAGARLAHLVSEARSTVATGFIGTPLITEALTAAGRPDLAYAMLFETAMPSWLYAVTMGATTIWERWDSMLPDGSINPGEMTSFNHYAYGAVADWLHRSVAGLAPAAPGYREVVVRPLPTHRLTSASARYDSPYGPMSVEWSSVGVFTLRVTLPPGVTGTAWLPGSSTGTPLAHGTTTLTASAT